MELISNFCKAPSVSVRPLDDHTATYSEKYHIAPQPSNAKSPLQVTVRDAYCKCFSLGFVTEYFRLQMYSAEMYRSFLDE